MTEEAKKLGNQSASTEMYFRENGEASEVCPFEVQTFSGLTKREYFAGLAMQGMLAGNCFNGYESKKISEAATKQADALLEELSKTE